jgi:hypothetical protein
LGQLKQVVRRKEEISTQSTILMVIYFIEGEKMIYKRIFLLSMASFFLSRSILLSAADLYPLPDTGQTKCYNLAGTEISCPSVGESLYGQDANYDGLLPSYTDNSNGTVTDNNTGLIWQQDTADTNEDSTITSADELTLQEAVNYCDDLFYANLSDWRLPERIELQSIVDYGRFNPAIAPVFLCESSGYWSATRRALNGNTFWIFGFNYGSTGLGGTAGTLYVRCVSDGL